MQLESKKYVLPKVNDLVSLIKIKYTAKERLRLVKLLNEEKYAEPSKGQLIVELKEAVKEVNLAKQGKIKLKSFDEFLNEL